MPKFPEPISNLINEFNKLPGIGPKTSERFVFYLLKQPKEEISRLSQVLENLKDKITYCSACQNISEKNPCYICSDQRRDKKVICVVAESHDMASIENTGEYKGLYHVLGGDLNPLEGITPDRLKIKELLARVKNDGVKEIILALNPDLEGESTILYLTKILKPLNIKTTRLARGLPMGSDLEYADEVTLSNALKGRLEI